MINKQKWLKLDDIQIVSMMIRENLKNHDYQKLESAIQAGFEKLPRTKHYKKLLFTSTLSLFDHLLKIKQYYKGLEIIEKARQAFPRNRKILKNEIHLLELIFNLHYNDFVYRDFLLYKTATTLLLNTCQKGSPKAKSVLENLIDTLDSLSGNAKKEEESKNTFYLEGFLLNLYGDLSKDEQIEEFTKIIAPEILKWIAENVENKSEDEGESESDEQED